MEDSFGRHSFQLTEKHKFSRDAIACILVDRERRYLGMEFIREGVVEYIKASRMNIKFQGITIACSSLRSLGRRLQGGQVHLSQ